MSDVRPQKLYTKKESLKRLGISGTHYRQLIEAGILPRPVALVEGARPVHIEAHFTLCERNLHQKMMLEHKEIEERNWRNGNKPTKPIKPLAPNETSRMRIKF